MSISEELTTLHDQQESLSNYYNLSAMAQAEYIFYICFDTKF